MVLIVVDSDRALRHANYVYKNNIIYAHAWYIYHNMSKLQLVRRIFFFTDDRVRSTV
jgi:hypothetical protein